MPDEFWAKGTSLDEEKRAVQLERILLNQKRDRLNERQQNVRGMVVLREIKENAEEVMKSVRSRLED
jgi:RecB family endonuclease NucS